MITIGICDDNKKELEEIKELCELCFGEKDQRSIRVFSSGEELISYVGDINNTRIDLLFLDIEMDGISGIEVKEQVVDCTNIWRIVFVTSFKEKALDGFGLKTIGYIGKPAKKDNVKRWIDIVNEHKKNELFFDIEELKNDLPSDLKIEEIKYIEADGSYTKIHTNRVEKSYYLLAKKLGEVEKLISKYPFVRVHKSYIVNMMKIKNFERGNVLIGIDTIPVGKVYHKLAKDTYNQYIKGEARNIRW